MLFCLVHCSWIWFWFYILVLISFCLFSFALVSFIWMLSMLLERTQSSCSLTVWHVRNWRFDSGCTFAFTLNFFLLRLVSWLFVIRMENVFYHCIALIADCSRTSVDVCQKMNRKQSKKLRMKKISTTISMLNLILLMRNDSEFLKKKELKIMIIPRKTRYELKLVVESEWTIFKCLNLCNVRSWSICSVHSCNWIKLVRVLNT